MQCILFQPLLADLYLIIVAVKDTLRGLATEHRQALAFFAFIGKKLDLPHDVAIL
ncbi:hypothetical protein SDC9_122332 [bioreactor metagenome]|uniref:Uncharacterized protein n=1 Tax=bioreactor metagenome TaxID=1076179 RepID=A0A645CEK8_9ZZZZ